MLSRNGNEPAGHERAGWRTAVERSARVHVESPTTRGSRCLRVEARVSDGARPLHHDSRAVAGARARPTHVRLDARDVVGITYTPPLVRRGARVPSQRRNERAFAASADSRLLTRSVMAPVYGNRSVVASPRPLSAAGVANLAPPRMGTSSRAAPIELLEVREPPRAALSKQIEPGCPRTASLV